MLQKLPSDSPPSRKTSSLCFFFFFCDGEFVDVGELAWSAFACGLVDFKCVTGVGLCRGVPLLRFFLLLIFTPTLVMSGLRNFSVSVAPASYF